ncbi:cytochrome P450 [Lentinus brumalis]|uniref:Cytochrome P450 n=1 Tax=Lentinus brumalis TaxID=2498619 RepID=A0A371CY99_9APHY|nr:cytochrome P450 [Polyporus brumalis]
MPSTYPGRTSRCTLVEYGEIISLNAFGTPMIVLGTHDAAVELLEKRSSNYADRNMETIAEIAGFDSLIAMMRYGPRWRKLRVVFHQCMSPSVMAQYHPIHLISAIIIRTTYGLQGADENDVHIKITEDAMDCVNNVFKPGQPYLVQTFPSLRHIPSWFPGATFKHQFASWVPIRQGNITPSIVTALMRRAEGQEDAEDVHAAAANAYLGVYLSSTPRVIASQTLSTLYTFFAAMASNPHTKTRAQDELNRRSKTSRTSLTSLPARRSACHGAQEDEYKGYCIPAGSIRFTPSCGAYARDPRYYPDPETFKPARFLLESGEWNPDVLDPAEIAFGYGRRMCPGRHFAEASLFTAIASVLHAFDVSAALDGEGAPVKLDVKMTKGAISYPEPFECTIRPRAAAAVALVRANSST